MAEREAVPTSSPDELETAAVPDNFSELLARFKALSKPENVTLAALIFLVLGSIWVGVEVLERAESYKKFLKGILTDGFEPPLATATEVANWLAAVSFILIALTAILGLYAAFTFRSIKQIRKDRNSIFKQKNAAEADRDSISAERNRLTGERTQLVEERDSLRTLFEEERKRVQTTLESRNDKLQRTLSGTIGAAARIRSQLFPVVANGSGKTFESVHYLYYVNKAFDTEVHRRYRIRAGDAPLHFWQTAIGVSEDASPIETFVDIDYRVISHDVGKDVVYLPTRNDLHNKAACIFFLPRIEPGDVRDIEVTYRWPRMALQFKQKGWEDFKIKFNSAGLLESYRLEVYLESGTGGTISCVESGVLLPNKSLEQATSSNGWSGWRYSASDVPVEILGNEISLRVKWNRA
jgi:hypothetical protein